MFGTLWIINTIAKTWFNDWFYFWILLVSLGAFMSVMLLAPFYSFLPLCSYNSFNIGPWFLFLILKSLKFITLKDTDIKGMLRYSNWIIQFLHLKCDPETIHLVSWSEKGREGQYSWVFSNSLRALHTGSMNWIS